MLDVEAVGQLVKGADECSMLKLLDSLLKELMNEADDGVTTGCLPDASRLHTAS